MGITALGPAAVSNGCYHISILMSGDENEFFEHRILQIPLLRYFVAVWLSANSYCLLIPQSGCHAGSLQREKPPGNLSVRNLYNQQLLKLTLYTSLHNSFSSLVPEIDLKVLDQ